LRIDEIHNLELEPIKLDNFKLALKNHCLFTKIDKKTVIATNKKYLTTALDFISKLENEYEVIFLDESSFETLLNKFIELKASDEFSEIETTKEDDIEDEFEITDFLKTSSDILTSEESAPIIKFVNSLFYQAIKKRASDIHIELHEFNGIVRFRIDGVLIKHIELDKKIINLVISRIKVISNLDISEKRIPQDGRTSVKIGGKILDVRVSVLPTFFGERVVMRILMESSEIPELNSLGINNNIIKKLLSLAKKSYGMILVTGPTSSGKSTTLHSLLHSIYTPEKNIITVEDPVEYKSEKINQIQVNEQIGLTFAKGLRSILRQDPDIILVGEIRDTETSKIAIQAALTGHLVLSTLHTNNAVSAINRLIDMGNERFLVSSSVLGVLAQRLVRVLCNECKVEDDIGEVYEDSYGISGVIYKAKGCKKCNYTGYSKRIAIAEFFEVDDEVRKLLKNEVDDKDLLNLALSQGMKPMGEVLKQMVINGITSLDEALRIGLF